MYHWLEGVGTIDGPTWSVKTSLLTPSENQGSETEIRLQAASPFEPLAPQHVRIEPFPFAESPAVFALERRVLPKRRCIRKEGGDVAVGAHAQ